MWLPISHGNYGVNGDQGGHDFHTMTSRPTGPALSAADLLQTYEARIAALERLVGRLALELDFLKGSPAMTRSGKREHVRYRWPKGISAAAGCTRTRRSRPRQALADLHEQELHGIVMPFYAGSTQMLNDVFIH